jgi:hypothetical protein
VWYLRYQGAIINWLQREYGEHVEVVYILYDKYLAARNKGRHCHPTHRARLSNLILLNTVIKRIVHDNAWYLPENPEFDYECLIYICGSMLCFQILREHHEFRGRRILQPIHPVGRGGAVPLGVTMAVARAGLLFWKNINF